MKEYSKKEVTEKLTTTKIITIHV